MTRKGPPSVKRAGSQLHILPIELHVGDRFRDEEGVWEVTGHPYTTREGKAVHATIQQPGKAAGAKERIWGAHEKLAVQRTEAAAERKAGPKSKRPTPPRTKGRR